MEDHGSWDVLAPSCGHAEVHHLRYCEVCPTCETICPNTKDLKEVYEDILAEIINVQDFADHTDTAYFRTLDRVARYIETH